MSHFRRFARSVMRPIRIGEEIVESFVYFAFFGLDYCRLAYLDLAVGKAHPTERGVQTGWEPILLRGCVRGEKIPDCLRCRGVGWVLHSGAGVGRCGRRIARARSLFGAGRRL